MNKINVYASVDVFLSVQVEITKNWKNPVIRPDVPSSRDPAGSAIGGRITGFIRRGRISGRTLVFSCSRRCLPNLFIINLSYSGGSAPCTVLSILLDGSHEPPVVMTKQKFRESHRVASLMPKGSEDTQRSSTMVINFLPGNAHRAQQHTTLPHTRVRQTLGLHFMFKLYFFTMIFFVFHENNISFLTGKLSGTHWCNPFFTK